MQILTYRMLQNPLLGLCLYSVLLTAGQAMFKLAALQTKASATSPLELTKTLVGTPIFLAGCLLYALSTVIWVGLLSRLPLSQAYPLVITMSIIMTSTLGIAFFKENLTADKIIGLVILSIGITILSR